MTLASAVSQLRHAYSLLVNGYVDPKNHRSFADGLLSPAISDIERVIERSRSEVINEAKVIALKLATGSCTCGAKSHIVAFHAGDCVYAQAQTIFDLLHNAI